MITSDEQLRVTILKDMQVAIDNTTKRLLEELQKMIQKTVYEAGTPDGYERTMQFLEMWRANPSLILGNSVVGEVSPDYNVLQTNRGKQQHIITGEALVNLIIQGWEEKWKELNGSDEAPYYAIPRDFWVDFKIYANSNAERIFMEEMKKANNVSFSVKF